MASVNGTSAADYIDLNTTNSDDTVYTYDGGDEVHAGSGNDFVNTGSGEDVLYGGTGVDQLYGGADGDWFDFSTTDSGDIFANQSDTIYDFTDQDQIVLFGSYTDAGNTNAPGDGQYSTWQNGSDWVVTWNAFNDDGYHDVIVKGDNPYGDITIIG
jgi:Ca2+-binding RTX toxin-like protein